MTFGSGLDSTIRSQHRFDGRALNEDLAKSRISDFRLRGTRAVHAVDCSILINFDAFDVRASDKKDRSRSSIFCEREITQIMETGRPG
jgi:hypothetical protein